MSTKDVRLFQSLPKWPSILKQEGRAKVDDVYSYLLKALKSSSDRNPQYFVAGWAEADQEQADEAALAKDLGESGKLIVVKPYLCS